LIFRGFGGLPPSKKVEFLASGSFFDESFFVEIFEACFATKQNKTKKISLQKNDEIKKA